MIGQGYPALIIFLLFKLKKGFENMIVNVNDIYPGDALEVKSNVFDIPERLRGIDPGAFVIFRKSTQKYEIHSTSNKDDATYCFTVPYDELDSRTIADFSRGQNVKKRIMEMKADNEYLEKSMQEKQDNYTNFAVGDIYDYAKSKTQMDKVKKDIGEATHVQF